MAFGGSKPPILKLDPPTELTFKGPFNEVVTETLTLRNLTNDRVIFNIKTTAPKQYIVQPWHDIIEPHDTCSVQVMLQPNDQSSAERSHHKFMVQYMFPPQGFQPNHLNQIWKTASALVTIQQQIRDIFQYPSETQVMNSKLYCVFVEPDPSEIAAAQTKAPIDEKQISLDTEEKKHLLAFQRVMANKGKLGQTIMQCLFVGHPRGGKSLLIKRLTGQPPTPSLPSTGLADKVIQVEVRKVETSAVMVSHSLWHILNFSDEAIALMALSSRQSQTREITEEDKIETEPHDEDVSAGNLHTDQTTSLHRDPSSVVSASAPMKLLMNALKQKGVVRLQEYLDKSLTLYLTDTGGQIEFQELLPTLVAGHFVIFLVFRLDQDLNKTFTVNYLHPDGQSAQPYQSSFTTMEMLLQSLASIASMGTYMFSDVQQSMSTEPMKPKVVFIGTHKDRVSYKEIEQIDSQLLQVVQKTAAYRDGLIEYASEHHSGMASQTHLVLPVNNLSPDDSDFSEVRSVVERISSRGDFKVIAPSTWLIFSLFLRQLGKRVITYDECMGHAHSCGIDTSEELNEALWFLHRKLGLIRYYHGEGLEDLQKTVIIDPQILFDKISRLIIDTFTFQKVSSVVYDEFKKKGIFSLCALKKISCEDEDNLLPLDRFIELLEHIHVIARLQEKEARFFMPCALAHVTSTAPVLAQPSAQEPPVSQLVSCSLSETPSKCISLVLPPPLLVTFKCGYTPRGLFSALVVYLLANRIESFLTWKLQTDKIFRNSISLSVTPFDSVALRVEPMYIEVGVVSEEMEQPFPIEETCVEVKRCIDIAIEKVTSSLNYTQDAQHSFAFYCTKNHQDIKHPAIIEYHRNKPVIMSCALQGCKSHFPPRHYHWFNEVSIGATDKGNHKQTTLEQQPAAEKETRRGHREVDRVLSDEDHYEISNYLVDLESSHLLILGSVLGISYTRLKKIEGCPTFCDEVVAFWLQRLDQVEQRGMPTWKNLVAALHHKRVGQNGLANDIACDKRL